MSKFLSQKNIFIIAIFAIVLLSSGVFILGENHFKSEDLKAFMLNDEQALEEHDENFYRELIDNQTDEFLIMETDVIVKFASAGWEKQMGLNEEDVVGKNFFSLVHPQDLPFIANSFIEILDSGEINDNIGPFRLINKNDESAMYMAKAIPIFNGEHKIILIGLILNDITNPLGGDEEKDISNIEHEELEELITMNSIK